MRQLIALLWGGVAALMGLLRAGPSIPAYRWPRLALVQIAASEDPGLAALAGAIGVWKGLRAPNSRAVKLGALGIALGLRPLFQRGTLARALSDAMREGLGLGWQRAIPPEVQRAFAQRGRTDVIGPLRALPRLRVSLTEDVLYAAPDGHPLRLDVYRPARAAGPCPVVIVVHGGAWCDGDKSRYALGLHDRWLAAHGYAVFDVQYRLGARWPAPLADVKCAIRWVKVNAQRFGADPQRVALLGRAAGAHLALLAAYMAGDPRFPPACFADSGADERVQAVVASAAPADLRLWMAERGGAIEQLLGGLPGEVPDAYAAASPVAHIRPGLPPTLIIHGQRDRSVPPLHAELLLNHLRAAGVPAVLLRIPWGRHGVDCLPIGLAGPLIQYDVDRFLAWAFHRGETVL